MEKENVIENVIVFKFNMKEGSVRGLHIEMPGYKEVSFGTEFQKRVSLDWPTTDFLANLSRGGEEIVHNLLEKAFLAGSKALSIGA